MSPVTSSPTPWPHSGERRDLLVTALASEPLPVRTIAPSPCTEACPAGINVKSYVSLIAERKFAKALKVVRERCPLPGICGRICHHPCETACLRGEFDEPVAIRALKRFVADLELAPAEGPVPSLPDRTSRVAIIGSGPAGLTAAYDLRRAGYPVTVFEAAPKPGGMLRYGIADYRLPVEILDAEIAALTATGIEIRTGCSIGRDLELEDLLTNGYAAALFAVGAQRGRRLRLPGEEECPQVEDALALLRRVNEGQRTPLAGRVLVVGGGSTAVETARTARRLGATAVDIVYRRDRDAMPADDEELVLAEMEGIGLRFLAAPSRIVLAGGRLQGLECLQVALGETDDSGRRRPIPIPDSEFLLPADWVFAAVGQQVELDFAPRPILDRLTDHGYLEVAPESAMTDLPGVFAAGDVLGGPATVIDAVATGHSAATAIGSFLATGHASVAPSRCTEPALAELGLPSISRPTAARRHPPLAGLIPRSSFSEVERAFSPRDAIAEAERCLRCGPCSECHVCAASCGHRHLVVRLGNGQAAPSVLVRAPARIAGGVTSGSTTSARLLSAATDTVGSETLGTAELEVALRPTRITIDASHCRGCARCVEVCAFDAIELVERDLAEPVAHVEPTLCRGCNLCTAVCPTDAAMPGSLAPGWWGTEVGDLFKPLAEAPPDSPAQVVLACQSRVGTLESDLARRGLAAEVVPCRCVGQIDAGMLLEIYRHGAGSILVAGCGLDDCRYGRGARLAAEQAEQAQAVLHTLGLSPAAIAADWSDEPAMALLELPMLRRVAESSIAPGATTTGARG